VLIQDRPSDLVLAWEAAKQQPKKFQSQLLQGMKRLPETQQNKLREVLGLTRVKKGSHRDATLFSLISPRPPSTQRRNGHILLCDPCGIKNYD